MLDNLLDQVKDDKLYDLNKLDVTLSSIMINAANKNVLKNYKNTTENEKKTRPKMKQKQKWMHKDCCLLPKEVRNLG